jgi:hypothetical protein
MTSDYSCTQSSESIVVHATPQDFLHEAPTQWPCVAEQALLMPSAPPSFKGDRSNAPRQDEIPGWL